MRKILLIIALSLCGHAWSSDIEKPKANSGEQYAKSEQRGTENSPVFINGIITTKKDETETNNDTKERELKAVVDSVKAQSDADLVKYTSYLATFTFLLFIAAAIQVVLFLWQLRLMNKATEDAGIAAEAAKESAEALPKIERAYVFLDEVKIEGISSVVATNGPDGKQVSHRIIDVRFAFKNHGKTPAILKELFCEVRMCNDFSEAIYAKGTMFASGKIISAGEPEGFFTKSTVNAPEYETAKTNGKPKLLLFGSIHYYDVLKQERETGFCWQCDFKSMEFRLALDPDHNNWT